MKKIRVTCCTCLQHARCKWRLHFASQRLSTCHVSHVTCYMSHATRDTCICCASPSCATGGMRRDRRTGPNRRCSRRHSTCIMRVTRHASHVTRHTSRVTRHTSHVTRHTSHVTRHASHVTRRSVQLVQHLQAAVCSIPVPPPLLLLPHSLSCCSRAQGCVARCNNVVHLLPQRLEHAPRVPQPALAPAKVVTGSSSSGSISGSSSSRRRRGVELERLKVIDGKALATGLGEGEGYAYTHKRTHKYTLTHTNIHTHTHTHTWV